jgi:phosphomannomutase
LSRGITDQGADVVNIGMVATPMLSFAVMKWNEEAGIMISASHHPGKYNAFKLIKNEKGAAHQLYGEKGIDDIKELAMSGNFEDAAEKGKITEKSINEEYKENILKNTKEIKNIKVVVDYGNGVGSLSAGPVLEKLPIEVVSMYAEPDGNFPNHEPNPHDINNLSHLQKKVVEEKADLGIFFDGDADRSLIIDEEGKIIFPDVALGILSAKELKNNPGGKVFYDLRFTKAVGEAVSEQGGIPVMMKVGNPFYKEALAEEKGLIAGEFSGHIMYKEYYSIDDGLFSAVKFMSIMSETGKKASELALPFAKYFQTEEINMKVADADKVFEDIKNKYVDGESGTIDGILISYHDWWLSVRKSNTEPLVRLRIEANTEELLREKREEVLGVIGG